MAPKASDTQESLGNTNSALSFNQLSQTKAGYQSAEATKSAQEQMLGSDEQMQGFNPEVEAFNTQYAFDADANKIQRQSGLMVGNKNKKAQAAVDQANALQKQALEAARNGDMAGAQALQAQAEALVGGLKAKTKRFVTNAQTAEGAAKTKLASQEGMAVGRLVRDANQLQDRNSQTYQDFMGALRDPALAAIDMSVIKGERSLAAEARGEQRDNRDLSISRGAARNPMAERALTARTAEDFGTRRAVNQLDAGIAKANVLFQTGVFAEKFTRQYAMDASKFAQGWVQGQAGLRDEYHLNLENMSKTMAAKYEAEANKHYQQAADLREQESEGSYGWVGTALSVVGTVLQVIPGWGTVVGGALMAVGGALSDAQAGDSSGANTSKMAGQAVQGIQARGPSSLGGPEGQGWTGSSAGGSFGNVQSGGSSTAPAFVGQGTNLG